ncbi:hypothetical protein KDX23_09970 [Burkholderia vietnamiensis]|uniref:glycosyl hydrolase family 28-related protein n=1 Tax=Burkholderia vietnamiensis TaxID=60552 RepID=UPI001B916EC1|nr:glycosyl hydrolase family 28-related protein [Burkholderia vietnamiensis]MBR8083070.1 hypothetical protein [Burkholderia vietnamiensis]
MTVTSSIQDTSYATDGSTTSFPTRFYFLNTNDVFVDKIDSNGAIAPLVLGTDYSVSGAGVESGGTVTTSVAYAAGSTLHIYRLVPVTQETEFQQNDPFPAKTVEKALDKLTMIAQQTDAAVVNSIRYPLSEYGTDGTLPKQADRAGKVLAFDSTGQQVLIPLPASVGAGDLKNEVWSDGADYVAGTSSSVNLSRAYGTKANLGIVVMAGVAQDPASYSLTNGGTTLQFDAPIPLGVSRIWCVGGTTLSLSVPPSGSVGDEQLAWGNHLGRVCDSIAELSALSPLTFTRAFVIGYYAAGDGGGGPYSYNASLSQGLANGGTIIAAYGGVGCWVLQSTGLVSLFQFGAKGDGVTDDTARIQAAVNWAMNSRLALFVPSTVNGFRTTAPIYISKGVTLIGAGTVPFGSTGPNGTRGPGSWFFLDHPGVGFSVATTADATFVTTVRFQNFGTYRKHTAAVGPGWTPTVFNFDFACNNADVIFNDMMLLNPYQGIYLSNGNAGRITLENVRGQFLAAGIVIDNALDTCRINNFHNWPFWINDTSITNWQTANATVISFTRCDNPFLTNIFSIFSLNGIYIGQSAAGTTSKLQAMNMDFDQCQNWLLIDSPVTIGVTGQFVNVVTFGPSPATTNGYNTRIRGSNCRLDFIGLNGEALAHGLITVDGAATRNVINVSNARIKSWDLVGAGSPVFNIAPGNTLYVSDRVVTDGGNGIVFGGGGAIKYPQGVSLGTGTIVNGTTSITLNHGLPLTPNINQIQICMTTGVGLAKNLWISAVTATTFTVTCDANPGANVSFNWRAALE